MKRAVEPLHLHAGDLDAARHALAPAGPPRVGLGLLLLCAALMTAAALALCAVVVLGGWSPQGTDAPAAQVRGVLQR